MAWAGYRQPSDWKSTVARIIRRDPSCQLRYPNCLGASDTADHCVPVAEGGSHQDHNLQGTCTRCHATKSKAEAARGRARAPRSRRTAEAHPGLT